MIPRLGAVGPVCTFSLWSAVVLYRVILGSPYFLGYFATILVDMTLGGEIYQSTSNGHCEDELWDGYLVVKSLEVEGRLKDHRCWLQAG